MSVVLVRYSFSVVFLVVFRWGSRSSSMRLSVMISVCLSLLV